MISDTLILSGCDLRNGLFECICAGAIGISQRLTNNDMQDMFYVTSRMILEILTLCECVLSN